MTVSQFYFDSVPSIYLKGDMTQIAGGAVIFLEDIPGGSGHAALEAASLQLKCFRQETSYTGPLSKSESLISETFTSSKTCKVKNGKASIDWTRVSPVFLALLKKAGALSSIASVDYKYAWKVIELTKSLRGYRNFGREADKEIHTLFKKLSTISKNYDN